VGYVCICATEAGGSRLARDPTLPGDRDAVRGRSVVVAMHMLRMLLAGEASG
jgi:nicotinamide mononucleotide (NMN) deamidase PncC